MLMMKVDAFEDIFASVTEDMEYVMINGAIVKVHSHVQGAKGRLIVRLL